MLEGIEALLVLSKFGTVTEAATRLRLTQSAVSKRIQNLQHEVGFPLTEAMGRRIRLTPQAEEFLERARPLIAQIQELKKPSTASVRMASFSVALADSIASSWGPAIVARAAQEGDFRVRLHAHRSVLLIESLRLGRYHMGVCTEASAPDLVSVPLGEERFVLLDIPEGRPGKRRGADVDSRPLISIEESSATWKAIQTQVAQDSTLSRMERIPVESFSAAVQMVRAGFGRGLIPEGLVRSLGIAPRHCRVLPHVTRRIVLLTRKSLSQSAGFDAFGTSLARELRGFLK